VSTMCPIFEREKLIFFFLFWLSYRNYFYLLLSKSRCFGGAWRKNGYLATTGIRAYILYTYIILAYRPLRTESFNGQFLLKYYVFIPEVFSENLPRKTKGESHKLCDDTALKTGPLLQSRLQNVTRHIRRVLLDPLFLNSAGLFVHLCF
jgi:hypothetical protein